MAIRYSIRAALAAFLCSLAFQVVAIPAIWKTSNTVPVRTPVSNIASNKAEYVSNTLAAANDGSIVSTATMPFKVGETTVTAALQKTVAANDIAFAVADAILSKTAVGLVASLALPYAIDAATGLYMKQVPGTQTPPDNCTNNCQTALDQCTAELNAFKASSPSYHVQCQVESTQVKFFINDNLLYPWILYNTYFFTPNSTNADKCTAPSVYDTALNMCLGSAINEPANAATLQADIAETFGQTPTKAIQALDDLQTAGYSKPLPATDPAVQTVSPQTVPGPLKTEEREYFDPATNHPIQEQRQEQTDYEIKPSPNNDAVEVVRHVSTTVQKYDPITGQTTTETGQASQGPAPNDIEKPDYTFTAPNPDYDDQIDTPEKTPLTPILDGMKGQITTWSSGVGIEASGGVCSMSNTWGMANASSTVTVSFCEWESQIGSIGLIILSFAVVYGGFIILGVKE